MYRKKWFPFKKHTVESAIKCQSLLDTDFVHCTKLKSDLLVLEPKGKVLGCGICLRAS